ncbi:Mu transposase C-terminal domain-containing protein [Leifsonia aquatica]|uniref:Mu transposase C-terminal domain-containing protein n=1 Tax=Leifsonia aquatica TaxID=144185 RepID=UPI0037F7C716
MTLALFDPNETITLEDNSNWRIAAVGGALVRLRNEIDGTYTEMHIGELSRRAAGLPRSWAPSAPDLRELPPKEQTRVLKLADDLEEVITGIHPRRPDVCRLAYGPMTSQNARVKAKQDELGVKRASMMRYLKLYREQGVVGLADPRTIRRYAPLANYDERLIEATQREFRARRNHSNVSQKTVIDSIEMALEREYGPGTVPTPSRSSWYRLFQRLGESKHQFTDSSAKTKMSLNNRPEAPYGKRQNGFAGGEVQVDSTLLDLWVRGPKGKPVRVVLTVLFDRATRMVIAYTFRLEAAKSVDHAMLLAQALTPRQNQPSRTEFRALVSRLNSNIQLMSDSERAFYVANAPFIRPVEIVIDNGADFLGGTFQAALKKFGIGVRFSAPHTPTSKPLVERNFGSISEMFLQSLPAGYLGRSPEQRGYKVEEQPLIDIFALHELFDDWLLKVWNHRPHGGLSDPMYPTVKLSPYQAYVASRDVTSALSATLTRDDYIQLMPLKRVVIGVHGVRINGRDYDSPLLNSLRGTKSDDPRNKGKWETHYDPYNGTYVWVKGPDGEWLECVSRDKELVFEPFIEKLDSNGELVYDAAGEVVYVDTWTQDEDDRALIAKFDSTLKAVGYTSFAAASEPTPALPTPSHSDTPPEDDEFDSTMTVL